MDEMNIQYFRELLAKHIKELKDHCRNWENISSNEILPEEVSDEIRSTIGLTNLLLRQKMKQFGELIDDSEYKRGEKEITCTDLQGFWDMVYNEVEKIQKNFKKLEKCQGNDWILVQEPIRKAEPKKKQIFANAAKLTVNAKSHASAARQRLAEAKLKMKQAQLSTTKKENDFEVEVIITTKDNLSSPLKSQNKKSIKDNDKSKRPVDEFAECTNMANLHISAPKVLKPIKSTVSSDIICTPTEVMKDNRKGTKSAKKASSRKNKENALSVPEVKLATSLPSTPFGNASNDPALYNRRRKKETIPLQCITRSAKKALLAKENAVKDGLPLID